jgi:FixJ family two-component response regulator
VKQENTSQGDHLRSTPSTIRQTRRPFTFSLIRNKSPTRGTEIAERLVISEKTVGNHVSSIFAKLQVNDRSQAIVRALRDGLVDYKR